jgi:flagellar assembly protein FliH
MEKSDIKPFQFADLQSHHVVSQNTSKPFEFKPLSGTSVQSEQASDDEIRSERSYALKNSFKIDGNVAEHRGLSRQEQNDFERKIQEEVERRIEDAYAKAYQEGIEKGKIEGRELALVELNKALAQKIEEFSGVVESVKAQTEGIVEKNKAEVYEFVKRFTKWIVMKEIDERSYLENLLEKLILELNARKNLIIKVGKNNFSQMPQIISNIESRLGQLTNVRVEIVPEIVHPGIILESENGLINGSLEGVFQNIDKIFEQIIKVE